MDSGSLYQPDIPVDAGARIPAAVWQFVNIFNPDGIFPFFYKIRQINLKLGIAIGPGENLFPIEVNGIVHIDSLKQKRETVGAKVLHRERFAVAADSLSI